MLKSHKYIDVADCERLCKKLDVILPNDVEIANTSTGIREKKRSHNISSTVTSKKAAKSKNSCVPDLDIHLNAGNALIASDGVHQVDQTHVEDPMVEEFLDEIVDSEIEQESNNTALSTIQLFAAKEKGLYFDENVSA